MTKSLTHLLLLLTLTAALAVAVAAVRLQSSADHARAAERDLRLCQADLADLAAWHVAVAAPAGGGGADDAAINRQVRQAAAGLADQLVGVEPGPPVRARDSDAVRTPVYLRLDGVTLAQTVTFLHALSAAPGSSLRTTGIELSAPTGPAAATARPGGGEVWTADLTVSQTSLAP